MGLHRKPAYAILASLVCLSMILRYPRSGHELGVDSFVIHGLVQVVLDSQYAAWIVNPLSLFGIYPLSHPSGPMLILASMSSLGGVSVEGSILLLDFIVAFLGIMGAFVMAREIHPDVRVMLVVAFVFAMSPRFITPLVWQTPTRALFTALMPWFIWSLMVLRRRPGMTQAMMFSTILFLMMVSHRLAVIVVVVIIAFVIAALFITGARLVRTLYPERMLRTSVRRLTRITWWLLTLGVGAYLIVFSEVLDAYQRGEVAQGTDVISQLQNLGVSLARSAGLLLPLAFLGIGTVIHARNKDLRHPWLIAVFLAFLPTLSLRQYTGAYIVPFAALFIGLGVIWLIDRLEQRPSLRRAAGAGIVVFAVASSAWVVAYDLSLLVDIDPEIYAGAVYLRHTSGETFVANSGILGAQLHAISGLPYMPIGGATTARQGPEILAFGFLKPEDMTIRLIPVTQMTIEDDSIFVLEDMNLEQVWALLLGRPIDDSPVEASLGMYNIRFYVEDQHYIGGFAAFGNVYYSPFGTTVASSRYRVYSSSMFTVYSV